MHNIVTYVQKNHYTFEEQPFTEVDSLVLAWVSYMHFPHEEWLDGAPVTIRNFYKAELFEKLVFEVHSPDETLELLAALAASPRFRDIKISDYEEVLDYSSSTQFAAMTFEIADELHYLAFRGTDSTLIGWKEDLDMALLKPVSSQTRALTYFTKIASQREGLFMLGGHSKGGNLAVYAGAKADYVLQDRVIQIFSHDGPGFLAEDFYDPGFARIRSLIDKTIPQSSMIGMVMEQECEYRIVHSNAMAVAQHNPFTWEVEDGHFIYMDNLTADSKLVYKSLNTWLTTMNQDERKKFIDAVFEILEETGAASFHELGDHFKQDLPIMAHKYRSMDKETKDFLKKSFIALAASMIKHPDKHAEDTHAKPAEA